MIGYGIWFALLEKLYEAEGDFQIRADEFWLEDFAEDFKVTDSRTLIRVFDTFAEVNLISPQLWAEHLIYCDSIVEKGDQYIKQRAYEAEKKRNQRAKKKQQTESEMSRGDISGHRDISQMSPDDEQNPKGKNKSQQKNNDAEKNDAFPLATPKPGNIEYSEMSRGDISGHRDISQMSPSQRSDLKDQNSDLKNKEYISLKENINIGEKNDFFEAELIDPSADQQQNRSADPGSQIVETKSSGAASLEMNSLSPLIRAYNASKPPLWAKVLKDNPSRQRALQRLLREYGSENLAIQALQDALAFCRRDSWWSTKNLGIDAILRDGRVTELAEKYKSIQENPSVGMVIDRLQDPKELERLRKKERQKQLLDGIRNLMEGGAAS